MPADQQSVQRRTVRVLSLAQVVGGVGVGTGIAVTGLIAEDASGSTALSGLAQTSAVLGAALASVPISRLMSSRGRRPGLVIGYLVAVAGALVVVVGAAAGLVTLVLVGSALFGCATTTNMQSRYAATDLAGPEHRARDLATVVWATTIGVVLGPNLTGPGTVVAGWLGLPALTGPLVFSMVAFVVGAAVVGTLLRPDPLLLARRVADPGEASSGRVGPTSLADSLRAVRASRPATLALVSVAIAHTVMVMVMVMTPVHMRHAGASLQVVGLVISAHVAGMYAVSPLVGWLADRWGRVPVLVLSQILLVLAAAVSGGVPGSFHAGLGLGLLLLGLGWSCALVAGSTLLTESVPERVRPGVQGAADLVMGTCGAAGGALAGLVMAGFGYAVLTVTAGSLVIPVLVLALLGRRSADDSTGPGEGGREEPSDDVPGVSLSIYR